MSKINHLGLLVLLSSFICARPASAQVTYDTLGLSGTIGNSLGLGPNIDSATTFQFFNHPSINDSGEITFNAKIAGNGVDAANDRGVWANFNGSLSLLAREGVTGPGPILEPGTFWQSLTNDPVINNMGDVVFLGIASTTTLSTSLAIHKITINNSETLARTGSAGPGPNLGAGVYFSTLNPPNIISAGGVAFSAVLSGAGITSVNNEVILKYINGTTFILAREGSVGPGPNLGNGVYFGGSGIFDYTKMSSNSIGDVTFSANLRDDAGTVNYQNDKGIFASVGGTVFTVARQGPSGPGPNQGLGVDFTGFFGRPVINDAGNIAFKAELSGSGVNGFNALGIWKYSNGTLSALVRSGSASLGPNIASGVHFLSFSDPVINQSGEVAFTATLTGNQVSQNNNSGLWVTNNGVTDLIAREGQQAPGINDPSVVFSGFGANILAINSNGAVAFWATLSGPGVGDYTTGLNNSRGLWISHNGVLQLVVREGDLFDVDPGVGVDLRTVLLPVNTAAGCLFGCYPDLGLAINNDNMLAFRLSFNDGSGGIFTAMLKSINPADLDADGDVDDADFGIAFAAFTGPGGSSSSPADLDNDGDVDDADFGIAFAAFTGPGGAVNVPEPASVGLLAIGGLLAARRRRA